MNELKKEEWHRLRRDLGGLLSDLQWQMLDGGTTRYAIDAADIRAYLEPLPGKFTMAGEDDRSALTIEQETLTWLLFSHGTAITQDRLLLLPSHMLELGSYINHIRAKAMNDSMEMQDKRDAIAREAASVANSVEFLRFASLVADGSAATDDVLNEIVTFIQQNASALKWFLRATSAEAPLARYNRLMEHGRLVDFEIATGITAESDEPTYQYWLKRLPVLRKGPRGAAVVDAGAVALLKTANDQGHAARQRICLITRSEAMHTLHVDDLPERERWQGLTILRHPRAFAALRNLPDSDAEAALRHLQSIYYSIELFLDASDASTGKQSHDIASQIQELRNQWSGLSQLAVSVAAPQQPDAFNEIQTFRQFFENVAGHEQLLARMESRRRELLKRIETSLQWSAFSLRRGTAENHVDNTVRARVQNERVVLSCAIASFPFEIELYSTDIQAIEQLFSDKPSAWQQLMDFVKDELSAKDNYEITLVMAYLMAVLTQWHSAEQFCRVAISKDFAPLHEAKYLLAVSLRKHRISPLRVREAIALLDAAIAERTSHDATPDPRYRIEKAVQIFWWNELYRRRSAGWRPPPLIEAIELTQSVIDEESCSSDLRLQAFGNLFAILTSDPALIKVEDRDWLRQRLKRLESDIASNARVANSPYVQESIYWGKFVLYQDEMTDGELEECAQKLENVSHSTEFAKNERDFVERHARVVREYQRDSNRGE